MLFALPLIRRIFLSKSITYILLSNRQNEVGQTEFAGWARMGTVRLKRFDF